MKKTISGKIKAVLLLLNLMFVMSGCGSDAALETYKVNMNQFFENIKVYDASINAIDPNSETASSELLALLDSMNTSFAQMATLEVPEDFPGVAELSAEASENMAEAVSFYHQAYEAEPFDANLANVAYQYYERANVRVQYIVSILHGDIPEEIYTYEDDPVEDDAAVDDPALSNPAEDDSAENAPAVEDPAAESSTSE